MTAQIQPLPQTGQPAGTAAGATAAQEAASQPGGAPARRRPHVIAITSGKGGVGKSSIAVNLGLSLARGGARVCIFDADTGLANINILLGLTPRLTLEHVLFGSAHIEEVMLEVPFGMKVVPGANGLSESVALQARQQLRLTRELARVEGEFDYLLVDTAAGVADDTLELVAAAHHALIVITPEPTSLTDAFSLIKLMARRRRAMSFQVVVNMCPNLIVGREVFQRFQSAVNKYVGVEVQALGYLLRDESLRNAVTLQQPVALFPESDPSCRNFLRLAESLRQTVSAAPPPFSFSGYWQRRFLARQQSRATAAAPEPSPLAQVHERLLSLLADETTPAPELAALLQTTLDHYLQRHDAQHLELTPIFARLAAQEGVAEATLQQWATALVPARPERAPATPATLTAVPPESGAANELWPQRAPAEAAPASIPTAIPTPIPVRGHTYDQARFGSQECLLQQLRQLGDGGNIVAWLTRFPAAVPEV